MFDNPLIRRYRYSLMRPRQLWIYMTIYITVLGLLFFINYTGYKYRMMYETVPNLCMSIYYQLLAVQVLVLWMWGSFNSGSAIKEEVTDKTYDFFRILPLTAGAKAAGILFGKNLVVLLLAAINFLLIVIFGLSGRVNAALLAQMILLLLSVAILANSVSLLSSINPTGKKRKGGIAGFIMLAFFLAPITINGLTQFAKLKELQSNMAKFYVIEIPVLILSSLVVLYFSCWAVKGILRKFTREDEPLFSRMGGLVFMAGYEFVCFGLFYPYLRGFIGKFSNVGAGAINYSFWVVSMFAVLAIPLGSVRSFEKYIEFSGLPAGRRGKKPGMLRLVMYSNLSLGCALFAIWAAVSILATHLVQLNLALHLQLAAVLLSFYLPLILLLELYVLFKPTVSRIGILLAFVAGVYVILPLILAGIFENEMLYLHSPLGYVIDMFGRPDLLLDSQVSIILTNLILCVVPALLALKRYLLVITARRRM